MNPYFVTSILFFLPFYISEFFLDALIFYFCMYECWSFPDDLFLIYSAWHLSRQHSSSLLTHFLLLFLLIYFMCHPTPSTLFFMPLSSGTASGISRDVRVVSLVVSLILSSMLSVRWFLWISFRETFLA